MTELTPNLAENILPAPIMQAVDAAGNPIEVTKMYEGTKTFWRYETSIRFLFFVHRSEIAGDGCCIEVISHYTTGDKEEAPRLYFSYSKIVARLKQQSDCNLQIGLYMANENSTHAQDMVAKYIFSRLTM